MSELKLLLLGPPSVEVDGEPVEIGRRKALALLAYLAVTGERHTRESLATLLWPDYDQSSAYAYLRRTLWSLNQTPVAGWIDADRESIAVVPGEDFWLDVAAFREGLAAAHGACSEQIPYLAGAVALFRGDFLEGFSLEDSTAFDEWQFFQAQSLRREVGGALEQLVTCHVEAGEMDAAIDSARRRLLLDPADEAMHRRLMELYARVGQRAEALRQYERCVRVLKEDLNLAPAAETVDLYKRIRAGEVAAAPAPTATSPASPVPGLSQEPALPPHNLPTQFTPFVGRREELGEVLRLMAQPDCRLLTLVGPGGMGKTRLALRAGESLLESFPNGVFFVPLAPLENASLIVSAVADALDFSFFQRESEQPLTQLLNYLREKRILLILDNFEHLVDGAELLGEIMAYAPCVKLLVTSRERLNLQGEWVMELTGMQVPILPSEDAEAYYGMPDSQLGHKALSSEDLPGYGAVALFLQSAWRAEVGFELAPEDVPHVVRVCRLLQGVPLGIELAATWVKALTCEEIAGEIARSLDFLTSSLRGLPERHQSLRAVFEHSWSLLSGAEQLLFRCLSVFRGGFTRDAAREVADASLPLLTSLVEQSLLRRTPEGRYEMLEVLRQYAAERLASDPGEEERVRDRHAAYYTGFLGALESDLKREGQVRALNEVGQELENVRAAWHWAVNRRRIGDLSRGVNSLDIFYNVRSRFVEAEEALSLAAKALEPLAERSEDIRRLLGRLLSLWGWIAYRLYRHAEARDLLRRSIERLEPLGLSSELAFANYLAVSVGTWMDSDVIQERIRRSLAYFESVGDQWGTGRVLVQMGSAFFFSDDYGGAMEFMQKGLALLRAQGDRWGMAMTYFAMGSVMQHLGQRAEAKRHYEESLALRREIGDPWGVSICLEYAGYVARRIGDFEEARAMHAESLEISRNIGDRLGIAGSLDNLGLVAMDQGRYDEAREYFEEGLALRRQVLQQPEDFAYSLEHLGDLARLMGRYEDARRYYRESLETYYSSMWASHPGISRANVGLGFAASEEGKFAEALEHYHEGLRTALDHNRLSLILDFAVGVADLLVRLDRLEEAAEYLGVALSSDSLAYVSRVHGERLLSELRDALPEELLDRAWARGRAWSSEELVARALMVEVQDV